MAAPQDRELLVLITGGTFDKEYDMITGSLYFKETHVPEMLTLGRCIVDTDVRTLMMKDSLHLTDGDRRIILESCRSSEHSRIVITHGTDTMTTTAALLAEANIPKTIILTGAMIPYKFGSSSDGFFNLGSSIAYAQSLPHGVYISMNGRAFDWNNVQKNRRSGFFEEIGSTARTPDFV